MFKRNILIDSLPETIEVDGREFPVRTDFRIGILFEQLVLDPDLTDGEKTEKAIRLFFEDEIPDDLGQAVDGILWFYSCGSYHAEDQNEKQKRASPKPARRVYDFEHDADLIYSAFLDQYGVDLQVEDMHWWRFRALFRALKDDNKISKIIEYRAIDLSTVKNKEERKRLARLKSEYALPCTLSEEQKVAMAGNAFSIKR